MQIAFHPEAHRVSTSPQQACLRQIISAVPCCCCAKQPHSWTALLRLHLCRLPFTQRRIESAPAHSNHACDRLYLLCHAAAVQISLTAGLHCCVYTYADCLSPRGASSQHQPTATMPETDYICCAMLLLCKQPHSWTALLRLHLCRLPFTLRRFELASAHSNHACDRLYLLCHAAAVQNSLTAGLHCCVYTYADCLSPRGASSQHQPTATMPETDYICCAMLLLCKQPHSWTALLRLHLCRLPFTQRRIESAPAHSKHA